MSVNVSEFETTLLTDKQLPFECELFYDIEWDQEQAGQYQIKNIRIFVDATYDYKSPTWVKIENTDHLVKQAEDKIAAFIDDQINGLGD